ncbi:MAG TPA: pantoate--beta-alanine ligase [Candidatus Limnocylindrales bacterium]|nr:pantoate--beta-alanine ligase [Candidatus Limnocylindrales bacterium]
MKIVRSVAKMQELSRQARAGGLTVGFVPTMGYLHDGHLSLLKRARELSDLVVVSIFVNPTQFNNPEDFENYPRDDKTDAALLEEEGVDVLFMPPASEVYPAGAATRISVAGLSGELCGKFRPGHFEGVATVVAALFNMVLPDFAVFGKKDFQQLQVIRRMVRDLHFPLRIVEAETVRERDGLAMSSRNARLSAAEREEAPVIHRALDAASALFAAGERDSSRLVAEAAGVLAGCAALRTEYLEVVDPDAIAATEVADERSVMAIAAWLGPVRLIDNVTLAEARFPVTERSSTGAGSHTRFANGAAAN